ncbi:MAG TPA: type II secretion system protein GspL [Burkholderiaceae bacterium]|nr:type II secretion system protein GspL [Burkholderiaceae bacterium]
MRDRSAQRLLVFLPPRLGGGRAPFASGTVVPYVALSARESTRGEAPVALLPKAGAVDLVFDSSDVFITAIESPKLSEGRLRMALPNILEDRLLADATDCHFAFTVPRGGTGTTTIAAQPKMPVAVIDRGILTRALDVVTDAGFKVRAAYSEIYTVPAPAAGVLSVRVDRGRGIARSATHDGFAFDLSDDAVPPALSLAVRQLGIKRIQVFGRDGARMAPLAKTLNVQIDVNAQEADPASTETGVSLLQGAFAQGGMIGGFTGSSRLSLSSRAVHVPLMWIAAGAAVAIVGMNAYSMKLESEEKTIRSQMETNFRSTFPEVTTVADTMVQTKQKLAEVRARAGIASANDFSVLNARTALLLSAAPVGSVSAMEYRDGALKVKFKPGVADNPGLQNALRSAALQQGLAIRFEADGSARVTAAGV